MSAPCLTDRENGDCGQSHLDAGDAARGKSVYFPEVYLNFWGAFRPGSSFPAFLFPKAFNAADGYVPPGPDE